MSLGDGSKVGWLSSPRTGGRWPGVQLHHDAFVVHADPSVLQHPPGDLVVQLGGAPRRIDEILLIGEPAPDHRATAMIRLSRRAEVGVDDDGMDTAPTVVVDRAAVTRTWADRRPLWPTLQELGLVPREWPEPTVAKGSVGEPAGGPAAIAVKSVTAGPADWCTIFWWLC